MTDLMRYVTDLEKIDGHSGGAPVDKWDPEYCGEIDLVIKRDGTWFHEGTPIGRARLVRLFSTVIRKDGEEYFLVTPVEKMKIEVEDAPFVAVLMDIRQTNGHQELVFTTNVGDEVVAGPDHPIDMRKNIATGERTPYIRIRRNLDALIARPVFYDLADIGEMGTIDGQKQFCVESQSVKFSLGSATELADDV